MAAHDHRPQPVGQALLPMDWGQITNLRLQARILAEGVWAGGHRSHRRGTGVEYGGGRPYVPGDDLRFLDRRSLLKHDRLMVRQFEMDTDQAVWLCLDASASMAFRGPTAPGSKLAYAALLAAATARIALSGFDPVGLGWLGGERSRDLAQGSGEVAFERVVANLERAQPRGDLHDSPRAIQQFVRRMAQRASRGSVLLFFSDLIDLPDPQAIAALGAGRRALVVVQVLDPVERDLSYTGKVRLRSLEGERRVETNADAVRERYRERLEEHVAGWRDALQAQGGRVVQACTSDPPIAILRELLQVVTEAGR